MIIKIIKNAKNVRIIRYLFSGGAGAFVDIGLLFILVHFFDLWYLFSSVLAFIAAFCVSFTLQKFVTFNEYSKDRIPSQIIFYFFIATSNLVLNTFLMYVGVDLFGFHYVATQVFVSGFIATYSFFIYKYRVFHSHDIVESQSQ